jgi:3-deoxy-manno-octulosonate cytidylyltransferase (CMP-KDO synthetase)
MDVVAVIPARYASTRFPGKPLANQTGKFLIQHVCEQVQRARRVQRVLVATDDPRIVDAVRSFGGDAVMTRSDHRTGTDRIAEVLAGLPGTPDDVILNVQGDEPEIDPTDLDRLVGRLLESNAPVATLACPFPTGADPRDPHAVKVVLNRRQEALYFSRSLVPYPRESGGAPTSGPWLLHLGVYAFRRAYLLDFAGHEPGELEGTEQLEQLRVLEHGYAMAVEMVEHACVGIDTPQDYERFVARIRGSGSAP